MIPKNLFQLADRCMKWLLSQLHCLLAAEQLRSLQFGFHCRCPTNRADYLEDWGFRFHPV